MRYGLFIFWLVLGAFAKLPAEPAAQAPAPGADHAVPETLNNPQGLGLGTATGLMAESNYQAETNYLLAKPKTPLSEDSNVSSREIDQKVGDVHLRGYLAQRKSGQPRGALLLIHEWWGLNVEIKNEARKLAGEGFKVLAIDLYDGAEPSNRREAARSMRQVKHSAALAQLKAGLKLVSENNGGKELRTGVIGWGFGGGLALNLAAADQGVGAVVVYDGEPLKNPREIAGLSAPILGFYGERGAWITPEKLKIFKNELKNSKSIIQTFSYGVRPGFTLRPKTAAEQAYAETSEKKMMNFLKQELVSG